MLKHSFLAVLSFVIYNYSTAQNFSGNNKPILNVVGVGTVSEFPNAAEITIYLEHVKPTLREALNENQKTSADVMEVVKQYVQDSSKVKVSLISTNKATRWDRRTERDVFVGFESTQRIVFTLLDLNKMQDFTEKLLKTKFNKIETVSYFNTEGDKFIKKAQEKAIADAKQTTDRLATAAGVKLGNIIYINNDESPNQSRKYNYNTYNFETFNKGMGGRGVSSSGQLIHYTSEVVMCTEITQ